MIIRARAPLRISFAGGGTEVEPYLSEHGGVVLSTTIDKYAYASMRPAPGGGITVRSLDYDTVAKYDLDEVSSEEDKLHLVRSVIREMNRDEGRQGLEFWLHTDAPPGSGLGSSSAMVVAIIGLFKQWLHLPLTSYEMADLAYRIERVDLGIKGGKQDQYAAVFGGFNFMEFQRGTTIVNPLRVPPEILNELRYNLLLCYTGKTRLSSRIIDTQVEGYINRREEVINALGELKRITVELKNALLLGDLTKFGELLHEAWLNKRQMAPQISDPVIDGLYETARREGAVGGKITGAGGGGYMFFYCRFDRKHRVAEALEKLGAKVVNCHFDGQGLQTWQTEG